MTAAKPIGRTRGWYPHRTPPRWWAVARELAWGVMPGHFADIFGANGVLNDPTNEEFGADTPWGPGYQLTGTRSGDESASWDSPRAYDRLLRAHRHYALVWAMKGGTVTAWEAFVSTDRNTGSSENGPNVRRNSTNTFVDFIGGYNGVSNVAQFSSATGFLLSDDAWHVYACVRHDQTAYFFRDGDLHSTDATITGDGAALVDGLNAFVVGNYRIADDTGTLYTIGPALVVGFLSLKDAADLCHDPTGPLRQERRPTGKAPAAVGGATPWFFNHIVRRRAV